MCLVVTCAAAAGRWTGEARQAPASRDARWQEDLGTFAGELSRQQKDFSLLYPKARFDRELAAIRQSVPSSPESAIVIALMRLVASANVAHTTVRAPQGALAFRRLPLSLSWYADGLGVTGATEPFRAALGTRVVRFGSMTPEQVEAAVAPYVSHENEMWLHQQSPALMTAVEMLQFLKIADAQGQVPITFVKPGGGPPFTLRVTPLDAAVATPMVSMYDALPIPPALYRKRLRSNYWYEYLPDSRTLYIQYNRCRDDPALAFGEFSAQVFALADAHAVDRTIVDLRFNQGGNSDVIAPLARGLKARPALVAAGHLYALIGRATFSSGLLAAMDFRDDLRAVLIGEPVGEKPNSYGEVRTITLPHSRLEVQFTTKFFRLMPHADPPTLAPHLLAPWSLADALAGRDPALDAALRHPLR